MPGADLVTFGSAATGLWLPGRDVDLSLKVPGLHSGRTETKQALHRVASVIYSFSGDKPENRLAAKVPLLRWVPSSASLPCFDITVNNLLAVENSRLVSGYLQAEPLLRSLVIVIKTWASERGINDRSQGTLSSFALTLMAVHLLQRRRVLPSLQDLAMLLGEPRRSVLEADCRFCSDGEVIEKEKAKLASLRMASAESLGAWLLDFFRYYGKEYKGGVIAIRSGASTAWRSASFSGQFYFVDNPFEPGRGWNVPWAERASEVS
ncbi:URT1 [Symbiodinium natans]|uniref:URT1 protein n=1 Tax=Symbiodinium natans TaxID=878477 RepID=A0A812QBF1_9DINO|nr:URT1 [Symbiodinium natans]